VTTEVNNAKVIAHDVSMSTERREFVSCENQVQSLDEESNWKLIAQLELEEDELDDENDKEDADFHESATVQAMQETTNTDRQAFSWSCYPSEEKRTIPQFIIIQQEKIIVSPELKTAEFIEAEISGCNNINGHGKHITTDEFVYNVQVHTGDDISAKYVMFGGSVENDAIIGKSADTFRGGTYSYYLKDLTQANVDADCCQQEVLYQLTTAEVIKTEATSESPVYCKFQLEDSDRIKSVFNQVLKLEPRYEDNDVQETKYGKLGFEEAMRDNPETSTWAGAIENRAMSVVGG